ncbi:hypothetical protein CA13_67800 [Planctomycetes bacterium CA13]|uniref:Uncharacterized protein n=1 Tax=Novipirellula herctigrandis TaxID=2527986 RepID=A0A5C5YN86_9BACT|nr:hypothetical protein CA13_67800 [Planctomycetes bacterium CA13]
MSRVAIVFGLLLCGLTIAGLIVSIHKMPSQFFPMMLGVPILFCGVVGLNPHRRRVSMQVAAMIAAVGMLTGGSNAVLSMTRIMHGVAVNPIALRIVFSAAVLCLVFLLCSIVSFLRNRAENRGMRTAVAK